MGIGGYRHKYTDIYENFTLPKSINKWRTTITIDAHASLVRILSFFCLSFLVKIFEEEIQPSEDHVDISRS